MSKHRTVNGRLLQMNKRYKQLKESQKQRIAVWMNEAYQMECEKKLSRSEALDYVLSCIEKANIWILEHEVKMRYGRKVDRLNRRRTRKQKAKDSAAVPSPEPNEEGLLSFAIIFLNLLCEKIFRIGLLQSCIAHILFVCQNTTHCTVCPFAFSARRSNPTRSQVIGDFIVCLSKQELAIN